MRRLIVCCDGTWNAPEKLDPQECPSTNVLKLARAILPTDKNGLTQAIEYVRGIGTGNVIDKLIGGVSGKGISSNILQAYQFISNNFRRGDLIFLFGFSRGAYTARSLSGFINYFGILKKEYQHMLPNFYNLYQRTSKTELLAAANQYRDKIDRDHEDPERRCIPIHFLGVWDTVGALGAPIGRLGRMMINHPVDFHDTALASNVTHAYHALAIHEYREHFLPTLWTTKEPHQTVEQVWFPGAHSDIGGGLAESGLSNIPLRWMAMKAESQGLEVNNFYLNQFAQNPLVPVNDSRTFKYKWVKPYVRLIGPNCTDPIEKAKSLSEFRHGSVDFRIKGMLPRILANRPGHAVAADRRSQSADLPISL
jgi:uncharacterized protein (DUF2235 family)